MNYDRKEYTKNYYLANKETIKSQAKAYYAANKESMKTQLKAYCLANKEARKAYAKEYRLANKEAIKVYNQTNKETIKAQRKTHYQANKEAINAKNKAYNKANRGVCTASTAKCRATKKLRIPGWVTLEELVAIRRFYENCPKGYHVDHIIPLQGESVSGLHVLSNLQYLTATDNLIKNNKFVPTIHSMNEYKMGGLL